MAQVLGLPLSSPNVNADFLRQGTVSETIAWLVLLGAEKQNLFRSMFVKNSMFSTSTKVNRPVATAELGKLLGGPCGSWDFYMSEQSPSALWRLWLTFVKIAVVSATHSRQAHTLTLLHGQKEKEKGKLLFLDITGTFAALLVHPHLERSTPASLWLGTFLDSCHKHFAISAHLFSSFASTPRVVLPPCCGP